MLSRRLFTASALLAVLTAAGCGPRQGQVKSYAVGPSLGGPFSLTDQDGHTVTDAALKGHWSAIYFGYTFCPDVCPTTLQALAQGLDKMGSKGGEVRTYFISVDPDRDTPAQLKAYLTNPIFPKNTVGLTGTGEQIAAAAKAYRVYYAKQGEGQDYLMNHQSVIYLMNPAGELARPLTGALSPDEIAGQIKDAMKQA